MRDAARQTIKYVGKRLPNVDHCVFCPFVPRGTCRARGRGLSEGRVRRASTTPSSATPPLPLRFRQTFSRSTSRLMTWSQRSRRKFLKARRG